MRLFSVLFAAAMACASACFAEEPAKKPAPLVACIEPAVMRTDAARLLPGSKLTVIIPATEDEFGLTRLSKKEFDATGLKWEQFLSQASAAAAAHLKTLTPEIHRDAKNTAQYAVLESKSHLTASIVLCPEFFTQFSEIFGDRLVAIVPDRFTVCVFPRGFTDFQTVGPTILEKYERSIWPCSQEAFEISADGLKCLGAFEEGEDKEDPPKKDAGQKPAAKPVKPSAKPAKPATPKKPASPPKRTGKQ
jgi:hypothetical protein